MNSEVKAIRKALINKRDRMIIMIEYNVIQGIDWMRCNFYDIILTFVMTAN